MTTLDLPAARKAADAGIGLSAKGAGENWIDQAVDLFSEYVRERKGMHFMVEDVRVWAEKRGLPKPPDSRSWGAVTRVVRNAGDIRIVGYGMQRSVTCHSSPKAIWEAI